MTIDEYRQLRTYSWYDGIYLAILWTAGFACLIGMPKLPLLSMTSNLITLSTPFFVGYHLKKYRDQGLGGYIDLKTAAVYCIRVFINASILFALVQWAYMKFLDNGYLFNTIISTISTEEGKTVIEAYGLSEREIKDAFSAITPTQFALTYFVLNTFIGLLLSLILSFIFKKT